MTMSFAPETRALYTSKIDVILSRSDLNTISAKRIRKELQNDFDYDLSQHKNEINELIEKRFDAFASDKGVIPASSPPEPVTTSTNGTSTPTNNHVDHSPASPPDSPAVKRSEDSEDLSDVVDDRPPKKKPKQQSSVDSDAAIAARLQAEENSRARPTRGNGQVKKRPPVKKTKTAKKKSSTKVKADDDSELESDVLDDKPKKKSGAFHKPQHLSPPLAELLGQTVFECVLKKLSRPQTVKGIWDYVKTNELQNPSDKRLIMCDDALKAVFKRDSVHMFTMNKILSTLLTPVDE